MKVGQKLKGDKFGLLYPNLRTFYVDVLRRAECFGTFGRSVGKVSSLVLTFPELLVIFKPWLKIFKKKRVL